MDRGLLIALLDSESSDQDSRLDTWYLLLKSDKEFIDILEKKSKEVSSKKFKVYESIPSNEHIGESKRSKKGRMGDA